MKKDKRGETELAEGEATIVNRLGLHARAAGNLRKTASGFKSDIELFNGTVTANAKSLLGLMALEAKKGTALKVRARGPDAPGALEAVIKLIDSRFGEKE